jgi:alpha-L-fucosidase
MKNILFTIVLLFLNISVFPQNKPEHEDWLLDAGFGMFIHWSMDSQLGVVISHSIVGASEDYVDRYFKELPRTFDPVDFDPDRMAVLAKLAGMKYMVFTAKHHSGFCMWDTESTPFNIRNTPYEKDIVESYIYACRKAGLKVGLYFSPEDFWFLHNNGEQIRRQDIENIPDELKTRYIDYVKLQCKELLTRYGPIDMMFFDGGEHFLIDALKPYCWNINPDLLITRGEIKTPEQHLPGIGSDRVWESCITMGTQWQFKPTNEDYKSGAQLIKMLVETRAKGGALLLNIGPDAYGNIPFEQDRNLREVAAWYFINHEAVNNVRPWIITNEDKIWFCRSKDSNSNIVYAVIFGQENWKRGDRREFVIHSVKSTDQTQITVLGQSDEIVEYMKVDPTSRIDQTDEGLEISVVRAQRIYNNHKWPNPIVVKLENVVPALEPPVIMTLENPEISNRTVRCTADLIDLGDAEKIKITFQYREAPDSLNKRISDEGWKQTEAIEIKQAGKYDIRLKDLEEKVYQYRAVAIHPKITISGDIMTFDISQNLLDQ